MARGAPAFEACIPILSQLLKAELAEREVRSIAYHMKAARFPAYRGLSGFDCAASEINEATAATFLWRPEIRNQRWVTSRWKTGSLLSGNQQGGKTGAELLFELISQRYERGATLITCGISLSRQRIDRA